jgi:seryl-tRNA synthetase
MIDFDEVKRQQADYRRAIAAKRIPLDFDRLLAVADERRNATRLVEELRRQRNQITALVKAGNERDKNIQHGRDLSEKLKVAESDLLKLQDQYRLLTALMPGLPAKEVPEGETDADNVEVKRFGTPRSFDFDFKDQMEIARIHRMTNHDGAREIAGSRAYALMGIGALLEMAVLQFALAHVLKKGFIPVMPPLLVNEAAMFGTGYFPLGEDSAYHLEKDDLYLTGTSEVGAVAIHINQTIDHATLPLRYAGISPCFRREAGAAGRDTKGFYRVHQFQKVEQIVICENDPEVSRAEHDALLVNAEEIVQALELPYRIVAVCTGDMGLGQVRKHDIETWMPSRNGYGETHSCSTFHDFQARRLNIRYKTVDGKKVFAHTLNNTAIASPRILIAILENHQNKDGSVTIPRALRPFLGGLEVIEPSA